MTDTPGNLQPLQSESRECRIRFVQQPTASDVVLLRFRDPAPCVALLLPDSTAPATATDGDTLALLLLPAASEVIQDLPHWLGLPADTGAEPAVHVAIRDVEVWWRPGRAVLRGDREDSEALILALAEFAYYEGELRSIEYEIATAWSELEVDNQLAFEVSAADLRRSTEVGRRMEQAFRRRIRLARIEPHLNAPAPPFPPGARKLGKELRKRSRLETRIELLDGQLAVFEHIYEMGSQRMGEYRASRQAHIVEWVIILLLAAETFLMLAQTIFKGRL